MLKSSIFEAVVAMASKQYSPFTDFRVRLAFGSLLIKPSNEGPTRRCTIGVSGVAGLGTAYKTGPSFVKPGSDMKEYRNL